MGMYDTREMELASVHGGGGSFNQSVSQSVSQPNPLDGHKPWAPSADHALIFLLSSDKGIIIIIVVASQPARKISYHDRASMCSLSLYIHIFGAQVCYYAKALR